MKTFLSWLIGAVVALVGSGCATTSQPPSPTAPARSSDAVTSGVAGGRPDRLGTGSASDLESIRTVLDQQVREWNAGNLAAFMETYARSDDTHFASGGNLNLGWHAVFTRYKRKYGDAAGMGTTTFSGLEITMLGPDAAMAFGRWQQKGSRGEGSGLFTLILRKRAEGWRITHDHTSSAP